METLGRTVTRSISLTLGLLAVMLAVACSSQKTEKPAPLPMITAGEVRAGTGEAGAFAISAANLPEGVRALEWELDVRLPALEVTGAAPGAAAPRWSEVTMTKVPDTPTSYTFRLEAAPGGTLKNGPQATVSFKAPTSIQARKPLHLANTTMIMSDGRRVPMQREAGTIAVSLISNPVTLAAFLAGVVAVIYWLAQFKALEKFFRYLPPLIWMYFVPMIATTIGITPDDSTFYSPFMSRVVLPAILILLLIPSDLPGLTKLGGKALFMMLSATTGIVLGAIGSFWLFTTIMPDALPKESWKGIAALSGSWIGGSPNMTAVFESVGTPPGIMGPLIVVDTVLAYSWLGFLIALSAYQKRIDRFHRANTAAIESMSIHLEQEHAANARAPRVADIAFILGLSMVASQICLWLGTPIYDFFTNKLGFKELADVINAYGWGILLITVVGLALSMTRARQLDYCGATSIGYVGLYLLLTTYGARADLRAVLEVPVFFGIGLVWLTIHVLVLYIALRFSKSPLFLASTSSMANIGGTASAPVVAAAYHQSMAPVGLLMAILGSILGTPVALFVVGVICKRIAGA